MSPQRRSEAFRKTSSSDRGLSQPRRSIVLGWPVCSQRGPRASRIGGTSYPRRSLPTIRIKIYQTFYGPRGDKDVVAGFRKQASARWKLLFPKSSICIVEKKNIGRWKWQLGQQGGRPYIREKPQAFRAATLARLGHLFADKDDILFRPFDEFKSPFAEDGQHAGVIFGGLGHHTFDAPAASHF